MRGNSGGPGVDGITLDDYAAQLDHRLEALRQGIATGNYCCDNLLGVALAQEGRRPRELAIPTVNDRVAQTAVALVLTPIFEAEFEDCSFAYRQGRSVRQAVERVERLRNEGFMWVVDADIQGYFNNIPHAPLLVLPVS